MLQVITSFAGELDPVFQAILTNATRICEAEHGTLFLFPMARFNRLPHMALLLHFHLSACALNRHPGRALVAWSVQRPPYKSPTC